MENFIFCAVSHVKSHRILCQIFAIVSSYHSNRLFHVIGKLQAWCWGSQGSVLGPILFLLFINDLPSKVIYNNAMNDDETTLFWYVATV